MNSASTSIKDYYNFDGNNRIHTFKIRSDVNIYNIDGEKIDTLKENDMIAVNEGTNGHDIYPWFVEILFKKPADGNYWIPAAADNSYSTPTYKSEDGEEISYVPNEDYFSNLYNIYKACSSYIPYNTTGVSVTNRAIV